jgi:hypothetical protein
MKYIAIVVAFLLTAGYSQYAAADYTVTCESTSGQTRNCPLYDGGRPYLQTQLSRSNCYEGQTWGSDGSNVWVSNGCRATFEVRQGNSSRGSSYKSSDSSDNGKALAAVAAIAIGAAAVAAANNNKDDHRGSYSHDNGRAYDYGNSYGHNYGNSYGNNYGNSGGNHYGSYGRRFTVTCESHDRDRKRCPVDVGRASVEVARQLSGSNCRFGRDWDYDRNAIYVWNGCRAVFSVE